MTPEQERRAMDILGDFIADYLARREAKKDAQDEMIARALDN